MKRMSRSKRTKRLRTRRTKRLRTKRSAKQRGGAYGLPSGYDHMMAISYKPKSDPGKLGSPDEVPTVGSMGGFLRDLERSDAIELE